MSSITGRTGAQIFAAAAAALGLFGLGAAMGWSQPAQRKVLDGEFEFAVKKKEFLWAVTLPALGPACSCIPVGYAGETLGLRTAMMLLAVPFLGAFILQTFSSNLVMLYVARFLLGYVGGAFCTTMPMYIAEISQRSTLGIISSYYYLFLALGMTFSFAIGPFLTLFWFNETLTLLPIVFFVIFYFMPESPLYFVRRNDVESTVKALHQLRGKHHDCLSEAYALTVYHARSLKEAITFTEAMRRPVFVKALLISIALLFFQQFGGINAVLFYWTVILRDCDSPFDPEMATLLVGVVWIISIIVAGFQIDDLNRRITLLISSSLKALSAGAIGAFFFLEHLDRSYVQDVMWLPIPMVCVFVFAFALGLGPVPWILFAELFPGEVKGLTTPIMCIVSWLFTFFATIAFAYSVKLIGIGPSFWVYAACSLFGFIFVFIFVPETRGLSAEEIQKVLAGKLRENRM